MNYPYPAEKSLGNSERNCHEKTCHCSGGEFWLFGGAERRGYQNEGDLAFGNYYRNLYGEFIRTGNLEKLQLGLRSLRIMEMSLNFLHQKDVFTTKLIYA